MPKTRRCFIKTDEREKIQDKRLKDAKLQRWKDRKMERAKGSLIPFAKGIPSVYQIKSELLQIIISCVVIDQALTYIDALLNLADL